MLRSEFILKISEFSFEQLIFIDKTSKDEQILSKIYRYFEINIKAKKSVVFVRGNKYTILLALTLNEFITAKIIEGSCNKKKF